MSQTPLLGPTWSKPGFESWRASSPMPMDAMTAAAPFIKVGSFTPFRGFSPSRTNRAPSWRHPTSFVAAGEPHRVSWPSIRVTATIRRWSSTAWSSSPHNSRNCAPTNIVSATLSTRPASQPRTIGSRSLVCSVRFSYLSYTTCRTSTGSCTTSDSHSTEEKSASSYFCSGAFRHPSFSPRLTIRAPFHEARNPSSALTRPPPAAPAHASTRSSVPSAATASRGVRPRPVTVR